MLVSTTELQPAAGPHGAVAPARYVEGKATPTYVYETRYMEDGPRRTVLIDGKPSALNRMEVRLEEARRSGHPVLGRLPHIRVTYPTGTLTELELPHRAFDGHVRAGTLDGDPVTQRPEYRALRDVTAADAKPLLNGSPVSLIFGAWDSTRKAHQVRFPSAIRSEIIGVVPDDANEPGKQMGRNGARKDDVAPSVQLDPAQAKALLDAQRDELSPKNIQQIESEIKKPKNGKVSGSRLGLGSIPPSVDGIGLVACERIIRSHVLSFSTLRQLRFGGTPEQDVAGRVVLAALALDGMARSDAELSLRANCDLREAGEPTVFLDERYGKTRALDLIDIDMADHLLQAAVEHAEKAGVLDWRGQYLDIVGSPSVMAAATADADDKAADD